MATFYHCQTAPPAAFIAEGCQDMSTVFLRFRLAIERLRGSSTVSHEEGLGRFVKNSSFQLTTNLVTSGAAFIQTILLARYLGVEKYGVLALLMTYAQFVGQFVSFNTWEVVTKYGSDFMVAGRRDKLLAAVKLGYLAEIAAGGVAVVVCMAGSGLASRELFHAAGLEMIVLVYSPVLLFGFMDNTSNAILRIHSQFKTIAVRDIVFAFFRLFSLLAVLLLSSSLLSVVLVLLLHGLVLTIFNFLLGFRLLKCSLLELVQTKLKVLLDHRAAIRSFVVNNYFSQCWTMIIGSTDTLFLGYFRSTTEVGLYRMGKNFFNLLARFIEPFYMVIYPDLAKLWAAKRYSSFLGLVKRGAILVTAVVTPLVLLVLFLIPTIITYAVGTGFLDAVDLSRVLICGAWVAAVFFWTRPAVLVMEKSHIPTIVNFFNMLVVIGLSLLVVPRYGALGTAVVYAVPIVFGNVLVGFYAYRTYRTAMA